MFHVEVIKDGDVTKVQKEILVDGQMYVDETPREGSLNTVTSGGVNKAIGDTKESVDEDVQDLQEQIDDIAEKAGSGYIPKGEADVAALNGLSGQENGWLYTMTDAGTLTDGSLAVVAGDTVAWDEANSVWYKAMDYAPRQYGTNKVHNLPTTITAFRTGDVIPVDGPSGSGTSDDPYVWAQGNGEAWADTSDAMHPNSMGARKLGQLTAQKIVDGFFSFNV